MTWVDRSGESGTSTLPSFVAGRGAVDPSARAASARGSLPGLTSCQTGHGVTSLEPDLSDHAAEPSRRA